MIICIDCKDGVSGDMLVGGLVNLGANENYIKNKLKSLKLEGFDIIFSRINKNGKPATDFNVILRDDNHDHDMNYLYGKSEAKVEIKIKRNIVAVEEILRNSMLNEREIEISMGIFNIIADAEAKAHKIDRKEVIFHENGAMDSKIDIVSFALCIEDLKIEKVYVKNLSEGYGEINTRVGVLPIPTPAVCNILERFNLSYNKLDFDIPKYKTIKEGYGCGKRDYKTSCRLKIEQILILKNN